jgi:hypothetical protein
MAAPEIPLGGVVFGESARWPDRRFWFSDRGTGEVVTVDLERPPHRRRARDHVLVFA